MPINEEQQVTGICRALCCCEIEWEYLPYGTSSSIKNIKENDKESSEGCLLLQDKQEQERGEAENSLPWGSIMFLMFLPFCPYHCSIK